jgi:hypothetical protein
MNGGGEFLLIDAASGVFDELYVKRITLALARPGRCISEASA